MTFKLHVFCKYWSQIFWFRIDGNSHYERILSVLTAGVMFNIRLPRVSNGNKNRGCSFIKSGTNWMMKEALTKCRDLIQIHISWHYEFTQKIEQKIRKTRQLLSRIPVNEDNNLKNILFSNYRWYLRRFISSHCHDSIRLEAHSTGPEMTT